MSLISFWREEADKIRDTSDILDTSDIISKEHLSSDSSIEDDNDISKPIVVNGMDAEALSKWVSVLPSEKQKSIFKAMELHPTKSFNFSSKDELKLHIEIREATIKRIIQLENLWQGGVNEIANYPTGNQPFSLPAEYWGFLNIPGESGAFITSVQADIADAINILMQSGNGIILDCNRMSAVIAYNGLLDIIGKVNFKKIFAARKRIILGTWNETYDDYGRISLIQEQCYKPEILYQQPHSEEVSTLCLPGDVVYFKNTPVYKFILQQLRNYIRNSNVSVEERNDILNDIRYDSAWAGEFCICIDTDRFAGFGLSDREDKDRIGLSALEIRENLLLKTEDLYNLMREKAKPVFEVLKNKNATPKLIEVILDDRCYRINTSLIIKKM